MTMGCPVIVSGGPSTGAIAKAWSHGAYLSKELVRSETGPFYRQSVAEQTIFDVTDVVSDESVAVARTEADGIVIGKPSCP